MKKIALLGLSAMMSMAFVACDNWEEPNPTPQTNKQGAILQTGDLTVADALTAGETYSLLALNDEGKNIVVATVATDKLAEGFTFKADMEISGNGFQTATPVVASVEPAETENLWNVVVAPADLQQAYYNGVSKGPKAKEIQARFKLYTVYGAMEALVGGNDNVYGPYTLTVEPYPSSLVIEENYYLLGTINGWDVATAVKFNHSDNNQYDDPVFSLKVDITTAQAAEGWWWKVVPESTYKNGAWMDAANSAYGVAENGDEAMSGMLVGRTATEDCGAGCLKVSGPYLMTINLEEGTYDFSLAIENLYTPGNSNGWNQAASQRLFTSDYSNYFGYAHLNGEFKFTSQPDWNGINFGFAADGQLSNDGGAGNINAGADGLYWCEANIAALTYKLTAVTTIGVIGDATPAGWDASTALKPSPDFTVWTGDIVFKAGEFKFRANDDWDINLGGDLSDLQQGGDNIASPGEGTYAVRLDLSSLPYKATLTKK